MRMIHLSRLFVGLSLAFTAANSQQILPFRGYQHEIAFPPFVGELHTSTTGNRQPLRQMSAGFHLNPPPPLPFLQSFPMNPFLIPAARNMWKSDSTPRNRDSPPLFNLFTPNTLSKRPESEAQNEEYRKYLKEEAEELEKEKQANEVLTTIGDFGVEATTTGANSETFVKLNVQGKNYSYSS